MLVIVEGIGSGAGRWQVTCADGEVLVVDTTDRTLTVVGQGPSWRLVSVDGCAVGVPGAFTVLDGDGQETPWFVARVVSVVSLTGPAVSTSVDTDAED